MDSVRFGRALGIGARAAAKTLVTAVDAATSPNPSGASSTSDTSAGERPGKVTAAAGQMGRQAARTTVRVQQATVQVQQAGQGVKRGGKRFGEAVWGPFVKLSGVLWLEFTGVFFGIFAMFAGAGAWKLRGAWRETAANHDPHVHFLIAVVMAIVFGYFFVSSFMKASRRGRRG
ncbi:MAG TPA: hypothetical protein VK627_07450 [Edaphobacter sp.]|nr:hypothetical protein [Edaphobacter sp.]